MTKMNINEQKMNQFLFYFDKFLEWLTKVRHSMKNYVHSDNKMQINKMQIFIYDNFNQIIFR